MTILFLSLVVVIHAVLCAKFFAVAEYGFDKSRIGNMSLFGGLFGMPLLYILIAKLGKRDTKVVFDVFAICAIITVLFARCNCLISGCCLGRQITSNSSLRWPTREIEVVYYIAFLVYMIPRILKGKTKGEVYPFYMFSYGALRFVLECFRVSDTNNIFHLAHIWAVIAIIVGYSVYASLTIRKKQNAR